MDYNFINDQTLREKLLQARSKRDISDNVIKGIPEKISANLINGDKYSTNKIQSKNKAAKRTHKTKVRKVKEIVKRNEIYSETSQKEKIKTQVTQKRNNSNQEYKKLKPPSTKELAVATKQLSTMIRTGLPLLEALNLIAESTENQTLQFVFKDTSIGISRGSTLVENLEKYPNIFSEMYLALVSAGEAGGLLPEVLERQAELLESLAKVKAQIKSALAYPIAIFVITILVVVAMLLFVIPIFVDIYEGSGTDLPALTQLLVDSSNLMRQFEFYLFAIPSLTFFYIFFNKQTKKYYFKLWRDKLLLKLPITKDLTTKYSLANFSRTLSSLSSAGVPILEALQISKRTLSNIVFKQVVDRMYSQIRSGSQFHTVLIEEKVIPIMFTSMFRIGEETGELSQMVTKLAEFYEDEVSNTVKSLTSILEPLLIVFVASIVAVILVAMYLPMFNMMNNVR